MFSALVLSFFAPLAPSSLAAQAGGCPNTIACDMSARVEEEGQAVSCGIGISLFGFDLSLGGTECPPRRFVYPAHQECHGRANGGTWCGKEQDLAVTEERCECSDVTIFGTGFTFPSCECDKLGNVGTIEDFGTRNCAEPRIRVPATNTPGGGTTGGASTGGGAGSGSGSGSSGGSTAPGATRSGATTAGTAS